jgi:protein involved in polysaccharide export with SLBB domain
MGEVHKPGGAYARAEALTLMKLVSLAAGFTKFAASSRITLIRENGVEGGNRELKPSHKMRLRVNVNVIEQDPKANPDISPESGDVIIVPRHYFR